MNRKWKRLVANLLCIIMVISNAATGLARPAEYQAVQKRSLISTEETVWKYLDNMLDLVVIEDEDFLNISSPSDASPSDASPSNASSSNATSVSDIYEKMEWTEEGFDDTAWQEAKGSFGMKRDESTETLLKNDHDGENDEMSSYFFRTTIEIQDLSAIEVLNGEIHYDGTAIVYMNGDEIYRTGESEESEESSGDKPKKELFQLVDRSMLHKGINTVAVELQPDGTSSSNLYFDFRSLEVGTAITDDDSFISTEHTQWNYLDDNTDPANGSESRTSWTLPEFNDSQWKGSKGSFGAKKGQIADLGGGYIPDTLLTHYINGTKKTIPAYFFRTEINIDDVEAISALKADIAYDDAIIVYINGVKVYQGNVPENGYRENLAYGAISGRSKPNQDTFEIWDLSMLKNGSNTVAVELHQDRDTSSDIYFDFCSLEATEIQNSFKAISLGMGADETQMRRR